MTVFPKVMLKLKLAGCDTSQTLFGDGRHYTELLRALLVPTMHCNVLMAALELIVCAVHTQKGFTVIMS